MDRTLRVSILSAKAQEARRYFISIRAMYPVPQTHQPPSRDSAARTDLSGASETPTFLSRVLHLKTRQRLVDTFQSTGGIATLEVEVYTAPKIAERHRPLSAGGRERPILVASGRHVINGRAAEAIMGGDTIQLSMDLPASEEYMGYMERTGAAAGTSSLLDTRADGDAEAEGGATAAHPPGSDSEGEDGGGGAAKVRAGAKAPATAFWLALEVMHAGSIRGRTFNTVAERDAAPTGQDDIAEAALHTFGAQSGHEDAADGAASPRDGPPDALARTATMGPGASGRVDLGAIKGVSVGPKRLPRAKTLPRKLFKAAAGSLALAGPKTEPSKVGTVRVLVHGCDGVPNLSRDDSGLLQPPSVMVAAKTLAEAEAGKRAAAVTRAAEGNDPRFHEVLELRVPDASMEQERVMLALVNSHRPDEVVSKVEIPLGGLHPAVHYTMDVALGEFSGSASAGQGIAERHSRIVLTVWIESSAHRLCSKYADLRASDFHLLRCAMARPSVEAMAEKRGRKGVVMMRWRLGLSEVTVERPRAIDIYAPSAKVVSEAAAVATRQMTRTDGQVVLDVVPAFYWDGRRITATYAGDAGDNTQAQLQVRLMSPSYRDMEVLACDAYLFTGMKKHEHLFTATVTMRDLIGPGHPLGELRVFDKPVGLWSAEGSPSVALQILPTDADIEFTTLKDKFNVRGIVGDDELFPDLDEAARELERLAQKPGEGLVGMLMLVQAVLHAVSVRSERAEQWGMTNEWRLREAKQREKDLMTDMGQMEKLVEAEREQRRRALSSATDLVNLPKEQLVERAHILHDALEMERAKSADLDAKWQKGHRDLVAARVAVKKLQELQRAYMEQQQAMRSREEDVERVGALKRTILSQEGVIAKLEDVIQGLVKENKSLKQGEAARRRELDVLSEQLRRSLGTAADADVFGKMQDRTKELWRDLEDARRARVEAEDALREEQRRRMQAETTVQALQQEIQDLTKRTGIEMSQWRAKYAEAVGRAGGGAAPPPAPTATGPPPQGRDTSLSPGRARPGGPPGGPPGGRGGPPGGRGGPGGRGPGFAAAGGAVMAAGRGRGPPPGGRGGPSPLRGASLSPPRGAGPPAGPSMAGRGRGPPGAGMGRGPPPRPRPVSVEGVGRQAPRRDEALRLEQRLGGDPRAAGAGRRRPVPAHRRGRWRAAWRARAATGGPRAAAWWPRTPTWAWEGPAGARTAAGPRNGAGGLS
ncbi:unnamed protein product [Pedinophyceae sp. YPF-701]|nr:unnamed protein product [Pedinophyceae sp. YPF-701]